MCLPPFFEAVTVWCEPLVFTVQLTNYGELLRKALTITRLHCKDIKISMHDAPLQSCSASWSNDTFIHHVHLVLQAAPGASSPAAGHWLFMISHRLLCCTWCCEFPILRAGFVTSREVGRQAFACLFVCCPHFRAGMAIGKHQPLWFS